MSGDCSFSAPLALRIGFQPLNYTTNEGSSVNVCVEVLQGTSAVPITLIVDTTEGTAEGIITQHSQSVNMILLSPFQKVTIILHNLLNLCLVLERPVPAQIS